MTPAPGTTASFGRYVRSRAHSSFATADTRCDVDLPTSPRYPSCCRRPLVLSPPSPVRIQPQRRAPRRLHLVPRQALNSLQQPAREQELVGRVCFASGWTRRLGLGGGDGGALGGSLGASSHDGELGERGRRAQEAARGRGLGCWLGGTGWAAGLGCGLGRDSGLGSAAVMAARSAAASVHPRTMASSASEVGAHRRPREAEGSAAGWAGGRAGRRGSAAVMVALGGRL